VSGKKNVLGHFLAIFTVLASAFSGGIANRVMKEVALCVGDWATALIQTAP
jgi:hypothetical protein